MAVRATIPVVEPKNQQDDMGEGDPELGPTDPDAIPESSGDSDELERALETDKYRDALQRARMLRASRDSAGAPIEEADIGRAIGQWVLAVRCECGRRWFEVRETYQVRCPRCGKVAYLEVELTEEE